MYERSSTASLASLSPIISFDIEHNELYYCVSACVSMWSPNLSSGNSMEATTPVQASSESEQNSDSDLTNEKEKELSPWQPPKLAKELYLEYWTALKKHFEQRDKRDSDIKFRKPQPQSWMGFKVGRSGFYLHTSASRDKRYISVGLTVRGVHGKSHFDRLKRSKTEIEREISAKLKWEENPKENYIYLNCWNIDLKNQRDWGRQHKWLCEQLETFYRVFSERIKAL